MMMMMMTIISCKKAFHLNHSAVRSKRPFQAVFEAMLGSSRILSVQWRQKKESIKDCRHTNLHHFCPFPPCGDTTCSDFGSLCSVQVVSWAISSFSKVGHKRGELEGNSWGREVSSYREVLDCVYSPIHTLMVEEPKTVVSDAEAHFNALMPLTGMML